MAFNLIGAKELQTLLEAGGTDLIDARPCEDYEHHHIPGAVNIPYDEKFDEVVKRTLHEKDASIVIYVGISEKDTYGKPYQRLVDGGFTNVRLLEDGLRAWLDQGFSVEFGQES